MLGLGIDAIDKARVFLSTSINNSHHMITSVFALYYNLKTHLFNIQSQRQPQSPYSNPHYPSQRSSYRPRSRRETDQILPTWLTFFYILLEDVEDSFNPPTLVTSPHPKHCRNPMRSYALHHARLKLPQPCPYGRILPRTIHGIIIPFDLTHLPTSHYASPASI